MNQKPPQRTQPSDAAVRRFASGEHGASIVEYGLLLGLVSLVCVTLIGSMSPSLVAIFNQVSLAL